MRTIRIEVQIECNGDWPGDDEVAEFGRGLFDSDIAARYGPCCILTIKDVSSEVLPEGGA